MKKRLALLGALCLCLSNVSGAFAGMPNIKLTAQGQGDFVECMNVQVTINGATYTVKAGSNTSVTGLPVMTGIPVKFVWGGYGNCGSATVMCSGSFNFAGSNASGTICQKSNQYSYENLNYNLKKVSTTGIIDNWEFRFDMTHAANTGIN